MMNFTEFVNYSEKFLDEFPPDVIDELEFVYLETEEELPPDMRRDNKRFNTITFGFFSTFFSPTVFMCYYAFVEAVRSGLFPESAVRAQIEETLLHEVRHYVEFKIGQPDLARQEAVQKFWLEQEIERRKSKNQ